MQGYKTLEGCAHIFKGCSQVMLRDCPWMMQEAEKNDVTKYKAIPGGYKKAVPGWCFSRLTDDARRNLSVPGYQN